MVCFIPLAAAQDDGTVPQHSLPHRTSDLLLPVTHTVEQEEEAEKEEEEEEEEEEEDTALSEDNILVNGVPQHSEEGICPLSFSFSLLTAGGLIAGESRGPRTSDGDGSNSVWVWMKLVLYQYVALLVKRFHISHRKMAVPVVQYVCPLVVIVMCLVISRYTESVPDPPPLLFRPSLFFGVNDYNYVFVGGVNSTPAHLDYASTLMRPCGLGAEVLDSSTDPSSRCYVGQKPDDCADYPDPLYNCSCECSGRATPPPRPTCFNGTVVSDAR